jgi:HAD superfamily phosphatase
MIVFDIDGVLVDVSDSYRETIVQTVRHFTGETISRERIQEYKNQGGWNNDWDLSQKICSDLGRTVEYGDVVREFNRLFLGENGGAGLIERERWIAQPGVLERLNERFDFAVFTGRLRFEAEITLRRFAAGLRFSALICADDVDHQKPHPEGLLKLRALDAEKPLVYVGDTVDDARASRAAEVPFVGVAAETHGHRRELIRLFEQERAAHIVDNINQLEQVLA